MRGTLKEIKEGMRRECMTQLRGGGLDQIVGGFCAYYAVPTNGAALRAFYRHVERIWLRTLRRRSQKDRLSWPRMQTLAADWIPQPRILHPYPDKRFAVTHPRWGRARESRLHGSERGTVSNGRPCRTSP
jgi:RNA-directed DNA polymerase